MTTVSKHVFVSIHAPARGATMTFGSRFKDKTGFNPRTREGCDKVRHDATTGQYPVSIHAPARGATKKSNAKAAEWVVSIHAPARGAT